MHGSLSPGDISISEQPLTMGEGTAFDVEHRAEDVTGKEIGEESRIAIETEHGMGFFEAVKLYPTSVAWSMFFSLGIIMLAFDPQLLGNLYATPAFQKDFGYLYEGEYIISAPWQTGLGMGNPIGQVVGALCAAYPMDWFGRRLVDLLS
jgi:SP family general alpha glucoside:H+ symporter-like MFS transporter